MIKVFWVFTPHLKAFRTREAADRNRHAHFARHGTMSGIFEDCDVLEEVRNEYFLRHKNKKVIK